MTSLEEEAKETFGKSISGLTETLEKFKTQIKERFEKHEENVESRRKGALELNHWVKNIRESIFLRKKGNEIFNNIHDCFYMEFKKEFKQ